MFRQIDYPAWAEAVEDSTLLVVRRSVLAELIAASPEMAMGMIAGLSDKLREFNRLLEAVTLKDVVARVAGALLARAPAGADAFHLPQTKRELAGQLGTTPETLSRTLGKLKAAGAIDVAGRQITLTDRDRLIEAADRGADAL
jgi:CRP/FNR family transcriptional regulator